MAAAREELASAQAALEGLLPEMRKQLGQPRMEYTRVINQGDHMIELPVDFRGVPKVPPYGRSGCRGFKPACPNCSVLFSRAETKAMLVML